jgi:hypothetical protein
MKEKDKDAFLGQLTEMKVYREGHDTVEFVKEDNLIEITKKTGAILSFYFDPVKTCGNEAIQLTFVDEKGKKHLGTIHSISDPDDVKSGLRKVFM